MLVESSPGQGPGKRKRKPERQRKKKEKKKPTTRSAPPRVALPYPLAMPTTYPTPLAGAPSARARPIWLPPADGQSPERAGGLLGGKPTPAKLASEPQAAYPTPDLHPRTLPTTAEATAPPARLPYTRPRHTSAHALRPGPPGRPTLHPPYTYPAPTLHSAPEQTGQPRARPQRTYPTPAALPNRPPSRVPSRPAYPAPLTLHRATAYLPYTSSHTAPSQPASQPATGASPGSPTLHPAPLVRSPSLSSRDQVKVGAADPAPQPTYPTPRPGQAEKDSATNTPQVLPRKARPRRALAGKSRRRRAYPQQIVTTRLLYCLQDPFAQLSRLQRI